MKTIIYYFSATGNSLVTARDLAKELGGADILPMPKTMKGTVEVSVDVVGIVFPVYMFGLPLIVANFLDNFRVGKDTYIFAVATFGGLQGRPFTMVKNILGKRGLELSAGFTVLMPGNYTPLYGAISEKQQKKMFDDEARRVKEIAEVVRSRKAGVFEEKPVVLNTLLHMLLYNFGSLSIPKADKGFWVTEACNGCGLCEKVCPVSNIIMKKGKPEWCHHCEQCMACLQWCPMEAIQYKKSTLGRKRYHHPNIKAVDIISE